MTLDPVARGRESSMLAAIVSDLALTIIMAVIGLWANSLMMMAEVVRGGLLLALEALLLVLLRRIHRRQLQTYEFGAGKLEQFANLAIGAAMALGALWVGGSAIYRWYDTPVHSETGLVFAAITGAVNVAQNGYILWQLWRTGRDGLSVIMRGQVRSRLAKFLSSCIVLFALIMNAILGPGSGGEEAEVLGSGFVALVMLELAVSMWRQALPSLLDRTLDEAQQQQINRALAVHFADYEELITVRSRVSGNTPIVEIVLSFAPDRAIGAVQTVADAVVATITDLLPGAEVAVIPVAAHATPVE